MSTLSSRSTAVVRRACLMGMLLTWSAPLWGQAPVATTSPPLPGVFDRTVPRSIEDLAEIESHVIQLVPRIAEATVSVRVGRNQGSGIIVAPNGLILCAAHVSGTPGGTARITTADGQNHVATVLGRNDTLDASLLKIQADRTDWPHCFLASETPEPGTWCLALGHPGGLQRDRPPVTRLGRVILSNRWLVQTDCDLIGGDSGGPLCNMRGEVIGINTRIGDRSEFNFHIPIEVYARDWARLLAGEDFKTHSGAYLGLSGEPEADGGGLKLTHVYPGNPAARAGLRVGDVITDFQETKITDLTQLSDLVGKEPPGKSVTVRILRSGEAKELSVRLAMRWD